MIVVSMNWLTVYWRLVNLPNEVPILRWLSMSKGDLATIAVKWANEWSNDLAVISNRQSDHEHFSYGFHACVCMCERDTERRIESLHVHKCVCVTLSLPLSLSVCLTVWMHMRIYMTWCCVYFCRQLAKFFSLELSIV